MRLGRAASVSEQEVNMTSPPGRSEMSGRVATIDRIDSTSDDVDDISDASQPVISATESMPARGRAAPGTGTTDRVIRRQNGPSQRGPVAAIFVHAGAGFHSVQNEKIHLKACSE